MSTTNHKLLAASMAPALALFAASAQANLIDIGNGLIYDDVDNVTWISDGLAFSNNIKATSTSPTANPYAGPLIGAVVTPQQGSPYTVGAGDFNYVSVLTPNRWFASWYAATAWVNNFTYQYGNTNLSGWRLPTSAEAVGLMNQIGVGNYGGPASPPPSNLQLGPFTWVPPKFWTADESSATNANFVDFANPSGALNGPSTGFPQGIGNTTKTGFSGVWAVVPGNVAAVPIPAAAWLLGSALLGISSLSRRKTA
jgi:hypothetical protein